MWVRTYQKPRAHIRQISLNQHCKRSTQMKIKNKINKRRQIIPSQIKIFNSSRHHSRLLISLSLHLNAIIIIIIINIIIIITCASPPCAPTPGHRIQILGAAARTAFSAGISVAPATKPTHESSNWKDGGNIMRNILWEGEEIKVFMKEVERNRRQKVVRERERLIW